jgi:hypothetical protein
LLAHTISSLGEVLMWIGQSGGIHPTFARFHMVNRAMIVPFWHLSNDISRIPRPALGRNHKLNCTEALQSLPKMDLQRLTA